MQIEKNKVVSIHYTGKLNDGSVFDSSEGKKPLEFIYGTGTIIPGLEEELEGLKTGDKKSIENIPADKAYGQRQEEAMQEVPKDQLPQDIELEEGMQLAAQGPQGVIPVTLTQIKDDSVIVDFNHPLAGKDLSFEVEIAEVRDATDEELEHGHVHGEGEEGHEEQSHEEETEQKENSQ